ncbi:MAG TPA: hypothetical protein VMM12_00490 [Longimicrobiales bacterium]|nr:hypothetical protein [Longimicrobiales bacterium]
MIRTGRMTMALCAGVLLSGAAAACGGQEPGLQADELAVLIDSLLPRIAEASGLEVRAPVRYAMQPRAEARAFIARQLEEEFGPGELEGMARAYKAFGLLPDTVDLDRLLLELYTEQVIGYYDPRTDRLYVVEGAERETAAPVVAHELVHALQDQLVPLDSLVARERGNDRQMAAQAAAEGQATLVMLALQAEQTMGRRLDPALLPDLAELLRPAAEAENAQFPVFNRAPRLIRETMLFPYVAGAAFLQALYRATDGDGPVVPFGDLLPHSTEQVMNPEARFLPRPDVPTEVWLERPAAGWRTVYENNLGQLEVSILLAEHLDDQAAAAAEGWDGDRYALLEGPGGGEALVWYSVWDDDAAADRFAAAYHRMLDRRPDRAGLARRSEAWGRPVVLVVEARAGVELGDVPVPAIERLQEVQNLDR